MSSLAHPIRLSMALARAGRGGGIRSCETPALPPLLAKALVLMEFGAGLFSGAGAEQVKAAGYFFFFSLQRVRNASSAVCPV